MSGPQRCLNDCFKQPFEVKRRSRVSASNRRLPQVRGVAARSRGLHHSGLTVAPRADHLLGEPGALFFASCSCGWGRVARVDARRWYARSQIPVNPVIDS